VICAEAKYGKCRRWDAGGRYHPVELFFASSWKKRVGGSRSGSPLLWCSVRGRKKAGCVGAVSTCKTLSLPQSVRDVRED
jgi:hypothetical protein